MWPSSRWPAVLLLLCAFVAAATGIVIEEGLLIGKELEGPLRTKGGWFKTCPGSLRNGKPVMGLPPGAPCNPKVEWQACYGGMQCLPDAASPTGLACQANQDAYDVGCTTKYKENEVCATGSDGPAADACCPRGLACVVASSDPSAAANWKCAVPPIPIAPPTGPLPADAGPRRRRPIPPTGAPLPPDVYPGVSDDVYFPGTPDGDKCNDEFWRNSDDPTWPCNCYDPKPECFCSPFHGGTNLVPPPLRLTGTKLRDATTGDRVTLKGVNWFGFELNDGLAFPTTTFWEPNVPCHGTDFTLVTTRLRMLGFNAVRLPFTFQNLRKRADSYQFRQCLVMTEDTFRDDTLPPELRGSAGLPPTPQYQGWKCLKSGTDVHYARGNFMIPGVVKGSNPKGYSVLDRLLWIVQHFAAQGLYTVLDYQPFAKSLDDLGGLQGEGASYGSPAALAAAWTDLLRAFKELPNNAYERYLKGRLIIDVLNEPDLLLCQWDRAAPAPRLAGEPPCPAYRDLVNAVVDAVYAEAPETIMIVEGTGQARDRCNVWGEGFRTRTWPAPGGTNGSSAESWFRSVNRAASVVLSTHQYCRITTYDKCSEAELFARFDQNFGAKSTGPGYVSKQWPYIFGEIGSGPNPYNKDDPTDKPAYYNEDTNFRDEELPCMESMVKYLTTSRIGGTKHKLPIGVFWWALNWNTGVVNGLFDFHRSDAGTDDDYKANVQVKWYKIEWMQRAIGLQPWYVTTPATATDDDD